MKKFTGPEIYDLALNVVILGFLIAIIVLLIKCQRSKGRENFAPINPSGDQQWKNGRFSTPSRFTNPETEQHPDISTAPIQLYS